MKISKIKLIAIFIIVIILLFENIILKNINFLEFTYMPRRITYKDQEIPEYENDYIMSEYALKYLTEFLNEMQKNPEEAILKYVDKDCYNIRIKNNKETFIKELKDKVIILDTEKNEHSVGFSAKYKNADGKNVLASYAIVLQKGLDYPSGYNVLINNNSKDKLKVMDIHVMEVSPYTFKIYFPDKTVIIEEDF
ncbi:MAG: hypothetical protein RR144_05970 [Clostridia bacterium]